MSFSVALSGLNAAQADLSVTANNIANANTTGFKESRAEFGDVFSETSFGLANVAPGGGVRLQDVAQQFKQGNINYTDNTLDMSISGEGFFTLAGNKGITYTRAGNFGADRDGYVVNNVGQRLQVFAPLPGGTSFNTAGMQDLRLSTADNPPAATTKMEVQANLPSNDVAPTTTPFNAADPTSYNRTTSATVYDSLGASHTANFYFVKGAGVNSWDMYSTIDGVSTGAAQPLTFSSDGQLTSPAGGSIALGAVALSNGSNPLSITVDASGLTQYGDTYSVSRLTQDGYTTGRLTGLEITADGVVQGRYSNGQATALGQLALASFPNSQGLARLGDTAWAESFSSGQPLRGAPGSGSLGRVQSGSLEQSNVDITAQLVNMITAQRNYQANAQMIQTNDQITQTIINIR